MAILWGGLFHWFRNLLGTSFYNEEGSFVPKDFHPQIQILLDAMAELNLPAIQNLSVGKAHVMFEDFSSKHRESYSSP